MTQMRDFYRFCWQGFVAVVSFGTALSIVVCLMSVPVVLLMKYAPPPAHTQGACK